ncbi:MAG: WSC-domain-containing protein [Aureobasidium pullulans]|nr:MAG: WSC-domain-containing protein [Aureobasidium pullulans]
MSRFLTPSKICILLLVQLYRDGNVPSKSTIPLLSFISKHTIHRSPLNTSNQQPLTPPSIEEFETLLKSHESAIPGRSLHQLFLDHLWAVHDFVTFTAFLQDQTSVTAPLKEQAEGSKVKLVCSPTSPIGQFARRCHLESVRLQFSDAYQLWEDLVVFREPTRATYVERNPKSPYAGYVPNAACANLLQAEQPEASAILIDRMNKQEGRPSVPSSLDDVEKVMHFQLGQLQKFGSRVSDEMKAQLRAMVEQGASKPSDMHFINFFDAWRSGAYNKAIELLHRYFDYTMESQGTDHIKTYHQYALLHLAVLHADFGCYGEAISAMNECIATARENQDARCLHFSLSWLAHLRKAYPEFSRLENGGEGSELAGNESDIITFLQQKAVENKDWATLSSSLLSQAEVIVESGGSVARALEQIYQSSYLNSLHNVTSMIPSQLRLHSAIFNRLGQMPLAEHYCKVMYHVFSKDASRPDILNVVLQNAHMHAILGQYEEAYELLRQNDPSKERTLRLDNTFTAFAAMISLRRAIHRNDFFEAEEFLRQLKPIRQTADAGVIFETHVLEIELLMRQGKLASAFNHIEKQVAEAKAADSSDIVRRIKLLILKARLFAKAGLPAKGFSIAMRAASSAQRAMIMPAMWEAVGALSVILIDLGEFSAAKSLVDAIMPQVLEGGNTTTIAQLYSILTDSYVGLAGKMSETDPKESSSHIDAAFTCLNRAHEAYVKVEDLDGILESLMKKAMLYKHRDDEDMVEEMERLYNTTVQEAERRQSANQSRDT